MESVVDNDAPLDYVEFQLFPNHDRYEACVCSGNTIETISSGLLGQLVLHLPRLKDLFSRGSKATFQIQCPENLDSSQWFTKATVTRFLHVVGSVNILNTTTSILNEITQLEEAKKFHLSLYAKDESEIAPSDASKHELLRAMELRLTTLGTELFNAFNRAAGSSCTLQTAADMEKLAQLLGDVKLRNTFRKFLEHSPMVQKADLPINFSNDTEKKSNEKSQVKKEAALERESSPESDKSCVSSEDDQPPGERSKSFARLASPRRSASPMRRVQIGRSGSRRATALTIKSLNIFPGRDKTQGYRDTDTYSSEEEGSKNKNSESNAQRISVKDAISLFENKQNNHTSEKSRSNLDDSLPRRRTSNVSESSSQLNSENVKVKKDDIVYKEIKHVEDVKEDKLYYPIHEKTLKPIDNQPDILVIQHEEDTENLSVSSEWNQRKEAELNEMMTKMMQSKPRRNQNRITVTKRTGAQDGPNEKREKLMREKAEKRAEKDAKFIAMQQVLEQRKAVIASSSSTVVMRSKSSISNPEKNRKNSTQILTSRKESLKPAVAPSTVRKSWSSTPSPRASIRGVSPVKTPGGTSSPGLTPTRRKTQPAPVGSQPSPKVERIFQKTKTKPSLAAPQTESRKRTKGILEKQPPPTSKNEKKINTKIRAISEKESSKDVAKPSFYNKVTKKSSVVPLESKPFLRKSTSPVVEKKASSPHKEPVKKPEIIIEVEKNKVNIDVIDTVSQLILDENIESVESRADVQSEAQLTTHQLSDQIVNCEKVVSSSDDCFRRMSDSEVISEVEEDLTISPTAWIDTEDQEDPYVPPDNNTYENAGPESTASPRIRHSLSQMLLRESELDMAEWGSAEIIPSIVYQKDAPKGLKRLLKFARKSKGDQNSTGWSTPSLFSEGEDDSEELKGFNKRNSDTSLRKVALHASNHGQQKTLHDEGHEIDFAGPQRLSAHLKLNNFSTSNSLLDHNYGAITTNKATRSFFSLSAFRGNKPN